MMEFSHITSHSWDIQKSSLDFGCQTQRLVWEWPAIPMDFHFQIDIRNFGIPLAPHISYTLIHSYTLYILTSHVIPTLLIIASVAGYPVHVRPRPGRCPLRHHLSAGLHGGRVGARGVDYCLQAGVAQAAGVCPWCIPRCGPRVSGQLMRKHSLVKPRPGERHGFSGSFVSIKGKPLIRTASWMSLKGYYHYLAAITTPLPWANMPLECHLKTHKDCLVSTSVSLQIEHHYQSSIVLRRVQNGMHWNVEKKHESWDTLSRLLSI